MGVLIRQTTRNYFAMLVIISFLSAAPVSSAEPPFSLQEQKVKAGLIYNFLKYTEWEKGPEGNRMQLCLIGGDPFGGYLNPLQGRTAQQQVIEIRYMYEPGLQLQSCKVAVIHRDLTSRLPSLLTTLRRYGILTVSDIEGFSRRGGMIEMATGDDKRVHLYISQKALTASGLGINERLLKLAELVE